LSDTKVHWFGNKANLPWRPLADKKDITRNGMPSEPAMHGHIIYVSDAIIGRIQIGALDAVGCD
jgi:hypothetical protein